MVRKNITVPTVVSQWGSRVERIPETTFILAGIDLRRRNRGAQYFVICRLVEFTGTAIVNVIVQIVVKVHGGFVGFEDCQHVLSR